MEEPEVLHIDDISQEKFVLALRELPSPIAEGFCVLRYKGLRPDGAGDVAYRQDAEAAGAIPFQRLGYTWAYGFWQGEYNQQDDRRSLGDATILERQLSGKIPAEVSFQFGHNQINPPEIQKGFEAWRALDGFLDTVLRRGYEVDVAQFNRNSRGRPLERNEEARGYPLECSHEGGGQGETESARDAGETGRKDKAQRKGD